MRHTLDYILDKKNDFKICVECGSFIWHEKDKCNSCSSTTIRDINQKDIIFLNKEIEMNGNYIVDV